MQPVYLLFANLEKTNLNLTAENVFFKPFSFALSNHLSLVHVHAIQASAFLRTSMDVDVFAILQ